LVIFPGRLSGRAAHLAVWGLLTPLVALAAAGAADSVCAEELRVRLSDASERGAFNLGTARAVLETSTETAEARNAMRLTYTVPEGTTAGVWAKAFPEELNAANVDAVRVGVRADEPAQARCVALAVELKGTSGTQWLPLNLQDDWSFRKEAVDWKTIGNLTEVVVLVRPTRGEATGTIDLDAAFTRVSWMQRLGTFVGARIGGILLLSLLGALLTTLSRGFYRHWWVPRVLGKAGAMAQRVPPTTAWLGRLPRDLLYGIATVLVAAMVLVLFSIGERSPLETGLMVLGIATAGAVAAELLKVRLTGKHLTPAEVFQDMVATGLLAASASSMAILEAPTTWTDLLLLSSAAAAATALVYHLAGAYQLASSRRHLSPIGGLVIVGTPYVFGVLVLLESAELLSALGSWLTAGAVATGPVMLETLGRVFVVFAFNVAVASGLALATRRRLLKSVRAYLILLAVAAMVVAAPWVAHAGSGETVAAWPVLPAALAALLATVFSQAGLWAEGYLITGMLLDALHGHAPSRRSALRHPLVGMRKGVIFSGLFMGILLSIELARNAAAVQWLIGQFPIVAAVGFGAAVFPLAKTIIESFDGRKAFFLRLQGAYRDPYLYLRGMIVGGGLAYALSHAMAQQEMSSRVVFGAGIGIAAFAGVNLLRDGYYALTDRGRPRVARAYAVDTLLGGFIGAALGFYFDATQVGVVVAKFHDYVTLGQTPEVYGVYPLLSKWGFLNLGTVTGGASLLFAEALAGVISWAIPAWLFAINRTVMEAYFRKEIAPIRSLCTREGMARLSQNMIEVLRWGLWMSPIIMSFLRPVGDPTWYNQDGAVRTLWAIFQNATLSPEAFQAWSLQVFVYLLAYDAVRVLIWLDHMGLRVATLVNLSFLGMDRLDGRIARLLGPSATGRYIPEGVKRFTTWAPLLIPFYIPRGANWDVAWNQSEALQAAHGPSMASTILSLPWPRMALLLFGATLVTTAVFATVRRLRRRARGNAAESHSLCNREYEVVLEENGQVYSRALKSGYDVSRRSYDRLDPAGRTLFLVDTEQEPGSPSRAWPVIGNFPTHGAAAPEVERRDDTLRVCTTSYGVRTTVDISLPAEDDPVELWTITLENCSDTARELKLVPYLEWVLNNPGVDRGHTQYNRLFAETEYTRRLHAVLAWDKHSKAIGILATDATPEGVLTSRIDFIGRARSLWNARALETLPFQSAKDIPAHPTFDPIGSLMLRVALMPRQKVRIRLLIGLPKTKKRANRLVARHLEVAGANSAPTFHKRKTRHAIRHGEIPPGTPRPYSEFSPDGRTLRVHTPFTPRPYDHAMSNSRGHVMVVTNRGLHTSSNGNAQQNRLTPDWADTVTQEVPSEAFYLLDLDTKEWFSPTWHPLNDARATHDVEFSAEGFATYRMTRDALATELSVFVPPEDSAGVYLLTVKNRSDVTRRIRLASYFQMVLANQPEQAGPLRIDYDKQLGALLFENPRNAYRGGPAFVAMSRMPERVETHRGAFFGAGRGVAEPVMVETGEPDIENRRDHRPIAALLDTLEIPPGQECTVSIVLGQADTRKQADTLIRKYRDVDQAWASLEHTRQWWRSLLDTVRVQTNEPHFDRYLDWLKYQALAERIWARRGFYQSSGAYGFRDQLQDSVNLIWVDPRLARRQILLHASQQFLEGDVVHWFHRLQDGRTGFAARTHASDNPLWLAWAVVEYLRTTGDESLLEERTPYLDAEQPLSPLPAGKHGMGFHPTRSTRSDTVYRHCMKAIDLVLEKRMGIHGLPLIGAGDWNDGLDEIGSEGRGESVWLGFFLHSILDRMTGVVWRKEGRAKQAYYLQRLDQLKQSLEQTWRGDRYLRAIHDDGTEIGVEGSGVWEIDALTVAWAVFAGMDPSRTQTAFETALRVLEKEKTILLGWPPLREDTKPYLGRSSRYPEGVRENGMYCHGVQWLISAARMLTEQSDRHGELEQARRYREIAYRLWLKISATPHVTPDEIEIYGGQPNKQAADMVTTFDPGRMIWHGYTGAAGWMLRQAIEGVLGARLVHDELVLPPDLAVPRGTLIVERVSREVAGSPIGAPLGLPTPFPPTMAATKCDATS